MICTSHYITCIIIIAAGSPCSVAHESSAELIVHCYDTRVANVPLSSYFWPGSGSNHSNNSPANHLQYQSSRSPLILAISWHNVSHYSDSGPDTWLAPTPRVFVSPRTEKYRHRKWASESRGTCRQDTSHFRPLPSADKFSPLGAGRGHQWRPEPEPRILSRPQWIQEFKDLTQ